MKHQKVQPKRLIERMSRRQPLRVLLAACILLLAPLWGGAALGANSKSPLAYVTERDSDSVSVIDTATNAVVDRLEVGPGPHGMVVTPNGRRGYVVNFGTFDIAGNPTSLNNTVSVIKTGRRSRRPDRPYWIRPPEVIDTVEVGEGPLGIAATPNGRYVYVTDFGTDRLDLGIGVPGNTVSVISTWTNRVVDRIEVGTLPAGIAITPNGRRAYVTNRGDDTVSVIEIQRRARRGKHRACCRGRLFNEVIATIPVGHKPANVAITPDGKTAYVTNFGLPPDLPLFPPGNTISVIDTDRNEVVDTIQVGTGPLGLAITPKGDKLYVVNVGSCDVSVIDIDTEPNDVIPIIPVEIDPVTGCGFGGPRAVAVTPDGARAYVTNFGRKTVEVIDTGTNTVVEMVDVTDVDPELIPGGLGPNWVTIPGRSK